MFHPLWVVVKTALVVVGANHFWAVWAEPCTCVYIYNYITRMYVFMHTGCATGSEVWCSKSWRHSTFVCITLCYWLDLSSRLWPTHSGLPGRGETVQYIYINVHCMYRFTCRLKNFGLHVISLKLPVATYIHAYMYLYIDYMCKRAKFTFTILFRKYPPPQHA